MQHELRYVHIAVKLMPCLDDQPSFTRFHLAVDPQVPRHAMIVIVINKMGIDEACLLPLDAIRRFVLVPAVS